MELNLSKAMIFPGQGSQSVGMQADLADNFSLIKKTYSEASDILDYDLWSLAQSGPSEKLNETVITQPLMLTAGIAAYRVWLEEGGKIPDQVAGHSLGEYTALVAAESLSFMDALKVVRKRAQLMQNAVPAGVGAMAAVLGLNDDIILDICRESSAKNIVEPVNFNSPMQVVIAGHKDAVEVAINLCKKAGAKRSILLPVSVPSHSSLMIDAGTLLSEILNSVNFKKPKISVISSSDACPYASVDEIRFKLSRQVHSPVRWVSTIKYIIGRGALSIIECGPGKVLTGLCRRIDKKINATCIDTVDSLQKSIIV
tara:strand:- start:4914 stop:5852 length:939 start_codon:yes stop_codon:yes gene_type:complete